MLKKVLLVFAVAALASGYANAQFSFGVRAGFNLTNIAMKVDGEKISGDNKGKFNPGFQVGVVGQYAFSESFAVQPGILFATQGAIFKNKFTEEGETFESKETLNINYLQIPINAQYKINLGGMKLLLQAGPYLGFGLGGKAKWENKYGGETEKGDSKIKFGDSKEDSDDFYIEKAFDFGLGFGAGLQFSNFQAGVGYNLGLTNMYDDDDFSWKNNGLALTLTYMFGK